MRTCFVASSEDSLGLRAVQILESLGFPTRVLENGHKAPGTSVALCTPKERIWTWPGRNLRMPPFRFEAPDWARSTPFRVALRDHPCGDLKQALLQMAEAYQQWYPGKMGMMTPWRSNPRYPAPAHQEELEDWLRAAADALAGRISLSQVLETHLEPVFGGQEIVERAIQEGGEGGVTLLIMGCALFNRAHTDVASSLVEHKAEAARQTLVGLIKDAESWIKEVVFVVVRDDFVEHPALRASLHPFFWSSIEEVERLLGRALEGETRLWGRTGRRNDEEVAESLGQGYRLMIEEIVNPVELSVNAPVRVVSWTRFFGRELLDSSWQISLENLSLAEAIYNRRVSLHEWYETVERTMGREAGLNRTLGNNAIYIAVYQWASQHPEALCVDVEVDTQFWDELWPVLSRLGPEPYIAMVPPAAREPWSY